MVCEGCAHLTSAPEVAIRTDIQAIKASPYVRKEIQIVGYVVDLYSRTPGTAATDARLREVTYVSTSSILLQDILMEVSVVCQMRPLRLRQQHQHHRQDSNAHQTKGKV